MVYFMYFNNNFQIYAMVIKYKIKRINTSTTFAKIILLCLDFGSYNINVLSYFDCIMSFFFQTL